MLRFGLCCIFREQQITFRQTTAKYLTRFPRREQLERLSAICLHNVQHVLQSLEYLVREKIGAFRILSPLFPRYTHPVTGYQLEDLPDAEQIEEVLAVIRMYRAEHDIRLSFHPDQFNVLSSPRQEVVENTIRELEYQGMLAESVGAGVINIHAGGRYGNKDESLARLKRNFRLLSAVVRSRLTLENDDMSYTPADLLPVCREMGIPFVYDIHHHRCLPDGMSETEATDQCVALWKHLGRETYFHISSPRNGWQNGSPKPHADYIRPEDFPLYWRGMDATVDVEAKAKELAVLQLKRDLGLA